MAFNGTEGEMITLEEAASMTGNYQYQNPGDIKASFYGKEQILALLNQTGAMGIRVYYGLDKDDVKQLVLVAADSNENDILGLTLERGKPCPPNCSSVNSLNSSSSR